MTPQPVPPIVQGLVFIAVLAAIHTAAPRFLPVVLLLAALYLVLTYSGPVAELVGRGPAGLARLVGTGVDGSTGGTAGKKRT